MRPQYGLAAIVPEYGAEISRRTGRPRRGRAAHCRGRKEVRRPAAPTNGRMVCCQVVPMNDDQMQLRCGQQSFGTLRGRPARLPQGRCRMRCPIFGRDALLRVRRRCGFLPHRFGASWLLPLLGDWNLGRREVLAAKNAKERKESAQHAPNVVQWFHIYDPIRS